MGMFGKIGSALGQIGKYYTSPEGAQSGLAILQDYGTGGSDNYRALQMQRQKLAQKQQQQQAMAALMARMRGPDTQTPQVNQLIGEANRMNGQRGGAPMETMTPQRAGLPMDQETMSLLAKYGAAGGNPQLPMAFSQMMQPEKPEFKTYSADDDIYQVGPDGTPTLFRPGTPKARPAPVGYDWTADGRLKAIPGGPGDPVQTRSLAESRWRPRVGRAAKPVDANSVKWD